jgi:hypothetical protein
MKKLGFCLIVWLLSACTSDCDDCSDEIANQLDGVLNESGVDVQLTFYMEDTLDVTIKNGNHFLFIDTTREINVPWYQCGLYINGCDSRLIDVKMKFLGNSPKCISFMGSVKNEKTDIRVVDSYQKVGGPVATIGRRIQAYEYVITSNLLEQAELCK